MDKKEFEERISRLQEIGRVVDKLPAEIRSDAFGLLKGYILGRSPLGSKTGHDDDEADDGLSDDSNLFGQFDHDKPADNVRLIAADLFRQYGAEPFSADEVKIIAANAGITVPARVDMTLRQARENGKHLFVSAGTGKFKPTVHGESHLKSTYGVKKGVMKRQEADK